MCMYMGGWDGCFLLFWGFIWDIVVLRQSWVFNGGLLGGAKEEDDE